LRRTSSFNSLCEIPLTPLLFTQSAIVLSILFVRFRKNSRRPRRGKGSLSILFVRFILESYERSLNVSFFQFSLWDSRLHREMKKKLNMTFNSLCEIPIHSHLLTRRQKLFQFSLWDSRALPPPPSPRVLCFQFSLWDSFEWSATDDESALDFQFSLWDSQERKSGGKGHFVFQFSLWDSQVSTAELGPGGFCFQFSLWDSSFTRWWSDGSLCFQFSLWDSRRNTSSSNRFLPFNSLCEILFDNEIVATDCISFNSLCEIPRLCLCFRFPKRSFNSLCEIL